MLVKAAAFVMDWEGLRLKSYKDTGGIWTIGYGTTRKIIEGMTITQEDAGDYLIDDLTNVMSKLSKLTKVPLTEHQSIALIDFIYNLGGGAYQRSTLRMKLNRQEYKSAGLEFLKWNKVHGKPIKGLTNRRIAESNLFLYNL
jgi:lysozyme